MITKFGLRCAIKSSKLATSSVARKAHMVPTRCFVALAPVQEVVGVTFPKTMLLPMRQDQNLNHEEAPLLPFNVGVKIRECKPESNEDKIARYGFDNKKDLIGQGFFAKVYKVQDAVTKETVAVKVINKSKCPQEIFSQELKVMSQLRDLKVKNCQDEGFQNLGLHKDLFETEEELCFVFDLHEGGDLFDEVVDNGALTEAEAKNLLITLLPSLESMHNNNFVHRDIKLENILLSKGGERKEKLSTAKLTDFGYAKKLGEQDRFSNPAGTFGYVAPEVLKTRRYGPQCDVWSMGTVLFTAIAGYQPFPYQSTSNKAEGPTPSTVLIKQELEAIQHGTKELNWNKEMQKPAFAKVSDAGKDLIRRMLDPNPNTRINMSEIISHRWMNSEDLQVKEG